MTTITSIGYEGKLRENGFARLLRRFAGLEHAVGGDGDWIVTAVPNADRTVSVAANIGEAYCCGVADTADGPITVQSPSVASGSRWDTVVARRDWRPDANAGGGATTILVLPGSSAFAIPSTREFNPGVVFDQPLALVQYVAGQAQPAQIIDLRVRAVPDGRFIGNYAASQALAAAGYAGSGLAIAAPGASDQEAGAKGGSNPRSMQAILAGLWSVLANRSTNVVPGSMVIRDSAGRTQVASPGSNDDATNRGYVDSQINQTQQYAVNVANAVTAVLALQSTNWPQASGYFGNDPQWLTEVTIAAQARPYRWQVVMSADIGATNAGTRWDLGVGYDGSSGSANGTFFDGTVGTDGAVSFQRFTSIISGVVPTGKTQRIYAVARRAYGSGGGQILASNRRFMVHLFRA